MSYLEDAIERYEINTELRLAALLATICFESDYFKTTVEYKSKPNSSNWIKYQSKYWGTGFYGRGLIQLTKKKNYEAFTHGCPPEAFALAIHLGVNLSSDVFDFVKHPEWIAHPFWAVESACWYWQEHNLNAYADKRQFSQIQGIVNKGSADKTALDLKDRQHLYAIALEAIPDDFTPAAPDKPTEAEPSETDSPDQKADETPGRSSFDSAAAWIATKRQATTEALGFTPDVPSLGSRVIVGIKAVLAAVFTWEAINTRNVVLFLCAAGVIIAAGYFWSKSRERADTRKSLKEGRIG